MALDDLFYERQPQPYAPMPAGRAAIHLVETLKDALQLVVRDAYPGVRDLQNHLGLLVPQAKGYRAAT